MENPLTCNNLKCRNELAESAVVTTCSHIFCLDCAHRLGITGHGAASRTTCPACNAQFSNDHGITVTNLNPTEEFKTSVLSGLSPNIIMECAGRALSFWAYQMTQELYYQQHLYKTLTEKYSSLSVRLEQTVNDANSEIENLHQRIRSQHRKTPSDSGTDLLLTGLAATQDGLRRKNEDLAQAYRDKSRKLLQVQELYDEMKRKTEMGQIQRAACDAVDSTLQATSNPIATATGFNRFQSSQARDHAEPLTSLGHANRFDPVGINTGMPRANIHPYSDESRWPKKSIHSLGRVAPTPVESFRQRPVNQSLAGGSSHSSFTGASGMFSGRDKRHQGNDTPNFAHHQGRLSGIGLTSGSKVGQPVNLSVLTPR
ncbi:E3 ubiquitin-protein ligase CCNB1IP1 [Cladobotryum mycophilum]|uniref:E3 ubiquitin-protein ligase CCNB1IP1 n=1 Tax=Cladobotryum mycophilum TaxID=491253 RepID=A0ABR0T187_9HYPO